MPEHKPTAIVRYRTTFFRNEGFSTKYQPNNAKNHRQAGRRFHPMPFCEVSDEHIPKRKCSFRKFRNEAGIPDCSEAEILVRTSGLLPPCPFFAAIGEPIPTIYLPEMDLRVLPQQSNPIVAHHHSIHRHIRILFEALSDRYVLRNGAHASIVLSGNRFLHKWVFHSES
ncbi:hypothetical protein D3C85_1393220 [compost metagenome]